MLEAAAQAYVFFLAGFETSSTTATYCLYELSLHQNLQDKVRKEIDDTLREHGKLTYDAVNEMTYLHKVVNGKYGGNLVIHFLFRKRENASFFYIYYIFDRDFEEISTRTCLESRLHQGNRSRDNKYSCVRRYFNYYTGIRDPSRSINISESR